MDISTTMSIHYSELGRIEASTGCAESVTGSKSVEEQGGFVPCISCGSPSACKPLCEYDRIDQEEIARIVAEHYSGPERVLRDREAAPRPYHKKEKVDD